MSKLMAIAELWLPTIGAGICIAWAIGAWYGDNKTLAIWLTFGGLVCLLLLVALQVQQHVISETSAPKPDSPDRPWISLGDPVVRSPIRFSDAGAILNLAFPIRHTGGRNPAFNVSFKSKLITLTPDRSAPAVERDRFVEELKNATESFFVFGERTLFQGDSFVIENDFFVPKAEIDQAAGLLAHNGVTENTYLPIFVACAAYKLIPGEKRHYTCIVGDIHYGKSALSSPFDTTKGDIPVSRITVAQLYAPYVD